LTRRSDGADARRADSGRSSFNMHGRDNTLEEMRAAMAGRLIAPSSFVP
jgi:hypothetical protein